jgi:hypothetical protein
MQRCCKIFIFVHRQSQSIMDINELYQVSTPSGRTQIGFTAVLSVKFTGEDETEPVTLQDAKDWCAVDGCDHDRKMTMLIKAARLQVEKVRKVSLINRTVTAKVKPCTDLPYGPIKSITSITDVDGATHEDYSKVTRDVTVVYAAGFGEALPDDYKLLILQQVAYLYENAGDNKDSKGGVSPMLRK